MSFVEELKRRNVVRVSIAYVIVAWLLAQVAELAADSFDAPGWVMKMLITVLALGLPLAVFFAWAFELTPEGLKREREVDRTQSIASQTGRKLDRTIIAVLAISLVYFAVDKFVLAPRTVSPPAGIAAERTEPAEKTPETIAVLPFVDMSPAGDNEYFSDGLTEELLNILAKIQELRVAGRTSSFAFKGKNEDLRTIGEKLNVKTILEGSVRKDETGQKVRITAQLVNVQDGFHLWSETYDRDLKDIFEIQDEIAREVAAALRITLLGEDEEKLSNRVVTDLNAYEHYLQGLKQFNDFSYASLRQAKANFEQSIELDPDYIPAQVGWLRSLYELTTTGAMTRKENIELALPVLERIFEKDPGNAEAHVLMASVQGLQRNVDEKQRQLNLALDADPRNIEALKEKGRFVFDMGDTRTGMEYLLEAHRLDPYSVPVLWDLCFTHALLLKPDQSEIYCGRIGEIQPDSPMRYYGPAMAYKFNGELARGMELMQRAMALDPNDYELPADMVTAWLSLGDAKQAEVWMQKTDALGAGQPVPVKARILLHHSREQFGMAADLARRAIENKLDDRQGSGDVIENAFIGNLINQGKIAQALDYFREKRPAVFEQPPQFELNHPFGAGDLVIIGMLLQIQDRDTPQAEIYYAAAEAKRALSDGLSLPWSRSLDRATLAAARGNKDEAIRHLYDAFEKNYRLDWRSWLPYAVEFQSLQNEPEFKRLLGLFEADMDRQRAEAYELMGDGPMSFFAELKRRNVVRVAIAYAVASWVLIQIGDVAAQNFEAPAWVMKMFMTALIVAFPVVLFFSWAYEITPEGIKKESEIDHNQSISQETGKKLEYVTIALLVIAIAFVAVDRLTPRQAAPEVVTTRPVTNEIGSTELTNLKPDMASNSIAVLPFLNMSNDPEQEYFSDGIAEELLNLLVRVEGLQVASRTSSFAYKGASPNIPQIAHDLKVANILEGSVRKSGNRVRITAQLIDTQNDRHLWSDTYDRELTDIFAIQDEIANAIVDALRTELGLDLEDQDIEVTAATDNLDAYDLFLKGHNLFISRQTIDESVRLLERAVELDPDYARAWGDLAAAASVAPGWNYRDRDYVAISRLAADKALELDENQSMVWAVKSELRNEEERGRDYNDNLLFLSKAIEIDPKNTTAWLWRGLAKSELGYQQEAIKDFNQCIKIDPGYMNCQFHLGNSLAYMGDNAAAIESQKMLFRNGFPGIIAPMVMVLLNMDESLAAYALAVRLGSHPDFPLVEWLDALEYPERDHSASITKAEAYLTIEKPIGLQEALMLAFGAYDRIEMDPHFPQSWIWTKAYKGFHQSPAFKEYVTKLNLPAYWREHGFPPQCRPLGAEGFECD